MYQAVNHGCSQNALYRISGLPSVVIPHIDYNGFQRQLAKDVRNLLRVIVMLLPVPFFWTLYDQQPTVWMVQALQMDCRLWGGLTMLPDQMQTLNTVFILVYIPIFQVRELRFPEASSPTADWALLPNSRPLTIGFFCAVPL